MDSVIPDPARRSALPALLLADHAASRRLPFGAALHAQLAAA